MIGKKRITTMLALAISAFGTSAASASAAEFRAAVSPVQIDGSQTTTNVFEVEGHRAECTTATFKTEGEVLEPSSTLEVHPEYSGCTVFSFLGTITTTGCNYVFHAVGTMDIKCTGSNAIKLSGGKCKAEVAGKTGLSSVAYTNNTDGTLTVTPNISAIKVTKTEDGFLCPLSGVGIVTNDTFTGADKETGTHLGAADAIEVS